MSRKTHAPLIENKPAARSNPLEAYFDAHTAGPGIWKWRHYFEIYHRHFAKFIGRPINIMEIGIYSGGSLKMWRTYFGEQARIVGVDIESSCKAYEDDMTQILIGDQAAPDFWRRVLPSLPTFDIVIDDGGHQFEQQKATLEALWPHIQPGGVYLCEDIHGESNRFTALVHTLCTHLNASPSMQNNEHDAERRLVCPRTEFQKKVHSIHQYAFVTVIEMNDESCSDELVAPKHGTQWEPFLR